MGIAVSSSRIVSANPSSSCSSPAPMWGPSHRVQSFMNFSSVGPSHGLQFFKNCSSMGRFLRVQSFRNRLLECGFPTGSQVLSANLLQHRLPSTGCSSCREPALAWALHRVTAPFGGIHLLWSGGPPWDAEWIGSPLLTSMGCRGTICQGDKMLTERMLPKSFPLVRPGTETFRIIR